MPTVRLDPEVYEALKKLAEPFVDTPSSVIRRLLEESGHLPRKPSPASATPPRPEPDATPQSVYEEMLLEVLDKQFKGRGDKRSVTLAIIERMQKQNLLKPADLELVATGETRAENAIAWGRNALKRRGLLKGDSERGIWQLSLEGRAHVKHRR